MEEKTGVQRWSHQKLLSEVLLGWEQKEEEISTLAFLRFSCAIYFSLFSPRLFSFPWFSLFHLSSVSLVADLIQIPSCGPREAHGMYHSCALVDGNR
jgi:hypothetical protein